MAKTAINDNEKPIFKIFAGLINKITKNANAIERKRLILLSIKMAKNTKNTIKKARMAEIGIPVNNK